MTGWRVPATWTPSLHSAEKKHWQRSESPRPSNRGRSSPCNTNIIPIYPTSLRSFLLHTPFWLIFTLTLAPTLALTLTPTIHPYPCLYPYSHPLDVRGWVRIGVSKMWQLCAVCRKRPQLVDLACEHDGNWHCY